MTEIDTKQLREAEARIEQLKAALDLASVINKQAEERIGEIVRDREWWKAQAKADQKDNAALRARLEAAEKK